MLNFSLFLDFRVSFYIGSTIKYIMCNIARGAKLASRLRRTIEMPLRPSGHLSSNRDDFPEFRSQLG